MSKSKQTGKRSRRRASVNGSASRDVIKSTLPPRENRELAEDLLARFPGLDRAELLRDMVASCFYDMRYGNKREERAACDFLNEVQRLANRNLNRTPNSVLGDTPAKTQNANP